MDRAKIRIVGAYVMYKSTICETRLTNITFYYNHSNGRIRTSYIKNTKTDEEYNKIANDLTLLHDEIEAWFKKDAVKDQIVNAQNMYAYSGGYANTITIDKNEAYVKTTTPEKIIFLDTHNFEVAKELINE